MVLVDETTSSSPPSFQNVRGGFAEILRSDEIHDQIHAGVGRDAEKTNELQNVIDILHVLTSKKVSTERHENRQTENAKHESRDGHQLLESVRRFAVVDRIGAMLDQRESGERNDGDQTSGVENEQRHLRHGSEFDVCELLNDERDPENG